MTTDETTSAWESYRKAIVELLSVRLKSNRIAIVPLDDRLLYREIAQAQFSLPNLRAASPRKVHWSNHVSQLPSWTSIAESIVFGEENSDDFKDARLRYGDRPYSYPHFLQQKLQDQTQSRLLLSHVSGGDLERFCEDFRLVTRAMMAESAIAGTHVVVFCGEPISIPVGAAVINVENAAEAFEQSMILALSEPLKGQKSEHLVKLSRAIAGLAAGSIERARISIEAVENASVETVEATESKFERHRRWFRRQVLNLLEQRYPRLIEEARRHSILGEVVYGLQRAALTSGTSLRGGLAAVIGEDLPSEYAAAAGNLAFLRWLGDLAEGAFFSDPDLVTFVDEATPQRAVMDILRELQDILTPGDALSEDPAEVKEVPENNDAEAVATTILLALGYSRESVRAAHHGLTQLAEPIKPQAIEKLARVAGWATDNLCRDRLEQGRPEARDLRRFLLVAWIGLQIVESVSDSIEAELQRVRDEADGFTEADAQKVRRLPPRVASRLVRKKGLVESDSGHEIEALLSRTRDIAAEQLRGRQNVFAECHAKIEGLRLRLREWGLGPACAGTRESPGRVTENGDGQFDTRFERALRKAARPSPWKLDLPIERLRFQWLTLRKRWMEAERLLQEFRELSKVRGEISQAEIQLLESQLLERRGLLEEAGQKYAQIRDQQDPTVDPVFWSRAHYGFLRSSLRIRGKPVVAALAGATAILDLESQRRADYALGPLEDKGRRVFLSFRGNIRKSIQAIQKRFEEGTRRLFCKIDEDRNEEEDFDPTIHLWLLTSDAIVILLTADYFESPWCIYELHTALHLRHFEDRSLGWLFVEHIGQGATKQDLRNVSAYVTSKVILKEQPVATQTLPSYRNERLERLFELGERVGTGVYGLKQSDGSPDESDAEQISKAIENFVLSRRNKDASTATIQTAG